MNYQMMCRRVTAALLIAAFSISSPSAQAARYQRVQREHLTPEEIELVRDAQEITRRMDVYIKAIERRLLALSDPQAAATKQVQKDMEKWGELPKGTRPQLISDIARILDEAINNIEDASMRSAQSPLLPKSLHKLADASTRFLGQLTSMRAGAPDENERERLEGAIENAQAIIDAATKLPPPPAKK